MCSSDLVETMHVSVTVKVLVTLLIIVNSERPTSTWIVKGLPVTAVGSVEYTLITFVLGD